MGDGWGVIEGLFEHQILARREFFRIFGNGGDFLGRQRTVPNPHIVKDRFEAGLRIVWLATEAQDARAGLALESDFLFPKESAIHMQAHRFSIIRKSGVLPFVLFLELGCMGVHFVNTLARAADIQDSGDLAEMSDGNAEVALTVFVVVFSE